MKRDMSVAGSFYPATAQEILEYIQHFNKYNPKTKHTTPPKALIVPHAGYIYSGFTANIAYKLASAYPYGHIVVIGPSHKVAYSGSSLCPFEEYETPFGALEADTTLYDKLQKQFHLPCYKQAHAEHSTEVQFPFIKHYYPGSKLLEIVYSQEEPHSLSKIINFLLRQKETLVVISTDLSHFYPLENAKKLDNICLNAIIKEEPSLLHQGCEACGKIGVEAMLLSAKENHLQVELLDYRTSADASGDTHSVVGYTSAAFYES